MNEFAWIRVVVVAAQFVFCAPSDAAPIAYFVTPAGKLLRVDTTAETVAAPITVGTNPYAAVVNPVGTRVYVSNFGDGTVSVVDTATNQVIKAVSVSAGPQGLAVSPDGKYVYVACFTANAVSVIDTGNNTVVKTISAFSAVDVAINTSGTLLYVVTGGVTIFETTSYSPVGGISVPAGLSPFGTLALSPDDSLLYAWADGAASVAVFNVTGASASFVTALSIPTGFANDGIAFDPTGARAYQNTGSSISIINTASPPGIVTAIPLTGATAGAVNGVAVTPDGAKVFVATASGARVMDMAPPHAVRSLLTGSVRALGKFIGPATSCTYSLSPLDLSNQPKTAGAASITVTTPAGCPVSATSFQPWVTVNSITASGGTTTVALQIGANTGAARATAIQVADRLYLITQQLGP